MSLEIFRRSCASEKLLEIVENVPAWYDGSRKDYPLRGRQIPLGARMITIVEAFDAMTTDHVYRPARSQERAMAELFECAGTQFDPELVERFAEFSGDQTAARCEVAHRGCNARSRGGQLLLGAELRADAGRRAERRRLFQARLLENMYDAVVFIDAAGRIVPGTTARSG